MSTPSDAIKQDDWDIAPDAVENILKELESDDKVKVAGFDVDGMLRGTIS